MPDVTKKGGKKKSFLPPEEIELKRLAYNKRHNEYQKAKGYSAQKKYRATHSSTTYEPKLRIPMDRKETLQHLLDETELFVKAVEEKYDVKLLNAIDKPEDV